MNKHEIIFIDNTYEKFNRKNPNNSVINSLITYCTVPAGELPYRIVSSFIPPVFGEQSRRIYVDFVGPCLALLIMATILHYGHAYKLQSAMSSLPPSEILLYYSFITPVLCFFIARLSNAELGFSEIIALLGYGLYGHIATLGLSQLFDHEKSNVIFFCILFIFAGLSALRIALVLLASIRSPPARLLVCSIVTTIHILFLVFVHFSYMHRSFVYGKKNH